jgi:hypothetical protein
MSNYKGGGRSRNSGNYRNNNNNRDNNNQRQNKKYNKRDGKERPPPPDPVLVGALSLVEQIDSKLFLFFSPFFLFFIKTLVLIGLFCFTEDVVVVLRDRKTIMGVLRSFDAYGKCLGGFFF